MKKISLLLTTVLFNIIYCQCGIRCNINCSKRNLNANKYCWDYDRLKKINLDI